ncbi:hypothetical protein HDU98_004923 [Podochytrium sp. JEL0797]|nr:hypothetical protein HDU98_004923 [Podochytrium sp. JEL0797]
MHLADLPPLLVEEIFSRLPLQSVWKLRIFSKSFLVLPSSESFAPQVYQNVYIRCQWSHLSILVWKKDERPLDMEIPTALMECRNLEVLEIVAWVKAWSV